MRHGVSAGPVEVLPGAHLESHQAYVARVDALIEHVPQPLRDSRIYRVSAACVHACADRHRARAFNLPVPSYALHVSELLDGFVALLTAAPSAETLAALKGSASQAPMLRALP
jgi:hypothetical protein